jgi:type III secretion protein J
VTVEHADFAAAVDLLNAHGLPSTPDIEISQMFPADALVSTPTAERARLLSAIEQRLEQSLMRIDQVISARVHASYELQSSERRKVAQPMRLSVLLTHEGEVEEGLFIEKVKRFIKNSFHELRYEDIGVALFRQSEPMMPARLPSTSISLSSGLMGIVAVLMMLLIGAWGLLRSGRGQGATIGVWKNTRWLKWLASQRKS